MSKTFTPTEADVKQVTNRYLLNLVVHQALTKMANHNSVDKGKLSNCVFDNLETQISSVQKKKRG